MSELLFRLYAYAHLFAKKLLKRDTLSANTKILSGLNAKISTTKETSQIWRTFVESSRIRQSGSFDGFHYAGYILEKSEWCLQSWIWTNAAIVRLYIATGEIDKAVKLGEKLMSKQQECGGWIVRNDYDAQGAIPMLAPNDSAYIANNAFLSLFHATGDERYLTVAKRCADWIMDTCRDDSMVYTGYNMRDDKWDKNNIIVDVGFTAGLFANLYMTSKESKYRDFLEKFIKQYIILFYNPEFKGFATSIDKNNNQQGGYFGRGQAWALEGLIPAYMVLKDDGVKAVIEDTIQNLVTRQNSDGSWSYNLSRKLMGNDCKGVSVIAKSISDWYLITKEKHLLLTVDKAYEWCRHHTVATGDARGGIFSFCTEGAIVRDLYSSCAFVYASAYAVELESFLQSNIH